LARKEQKVTGAIKRNVEEVMAARFLQQGGRLRIVKNPGSNVNAQSVPRIGQSECMLCLLLD